MCAENMIFLAFDDIAQNLLSQAESTGRLCLAGEEDDPIRENIVNGIINVIARDSPAEKINRELGLLTDVHTCVRGAGEEAAVYANRFNGAVARYVNHTNSMDGNTSHQFAAMLIRNARLSLDTTNSVSLQIVMMAHNKMDVEADVNVCLKLSDLKCLLSSVKGVQVSANFTSRVQNVLERAIDRCGSKKNQESTHFTLEEAIQANSQVKIRGESSEDPSNSQCSLLGKRSTREDSMDTPRRYIDDIKQRTRCHVCKEIGHWVRDRPECLEKAKERRRQAAEKKKAISASNAPESEPVKVKDDIPPSGSFFR